MPHLIYNGDYLALVRTSSNGSMGKATYRVVDPTMDDALVVSGTAEDVLAVMEDYMDDLRAVMTELRKERDARDRH